MQIGQTPNNSPHAYGFTFSLLRVGLLVTLCLFAASSAPAGLVAPTLSTFLFIAASAVALVGLLRGERLEPDRFGRWDEAAFLMASSILVGLFVDPEAMRAALSAVQQTAP